MFLGMQRSLRAGNLSKQTRPSELGRDQTALQDAAVLFGHSCLSLSSSLHQMIKASGGCFLCSMCSFWSISFVLMVQFPSSLCSLVPAWLPWGCCWDELHPIHGRSGHRATAQPGRVMGCVCRAVSMGSELEEGQSWVMERKCW